MIKGLGLTESGLRRIIAANAPGHLTLQDWDNNLDGYARYVARNGEVVRVKRAKAALKAVIPKERPSLLRNVEKEIHSLLCTNSRRYVPIREAFFSTRGRHSQTIVVSSIAAVIATTFNVALGLVTSLVALCLLAALKVGVGAYCSYYAERKALPDIKRSARTKR
ncbi:hypothetical protein GWE18_25095 [Bradyrhizobium sp. CSA112]|uniref:hypothetical protein n=1 Tax=Bradyrhizobium sp. CSA112 TaxID=2699170 RepID=UPI0023B17BD4|nr:hypothetical protein [Bradyrhizobium sp. CSA112]MDE5456043.1 hypothetical protein [Bradyrhizobium sp. CSA112]